MEILNYSKELSAPERQLRFIQLIEKIGQDEITEDQKALNLVGFLVGPSIMWARARFDYSTI